MMLTSTGSGSITTVGRTKVYYPAQKRGTAVSSVSGHNYDSAEFSAPAGRRSFQMEMVSRLSREVRTANTTGDIQELRREVGHILGVDKTHSLIVVGVGNLGRALLKNFHFANMGFTVEAAFDVDLRLVGTTIKGIPIYELRQLEAYTHRKVPDVAVLTVPQSVAQETADRLIACGIRGIWNFTNVELTAEGEDVQFENVHFADSLLTLNYRITRTLAQDT